MPTVTGTLSDIGLASLNGVAPTLVFTPSEGAVNGTGRVFASKPVTVTPDSTGYFSATLAATDDVLPRSAHWRLTIRWQNVNGYGNGAGYTANDALKWKIHVPAAGGRLADMIGERPPADSVYIGNTAPTSGSYTYWINTSVSPATLNVWSA